MKIITERGYDIRKSGDSCRAVSSSRYETTLSFLFRQISVNSLTIHLTHSESHSQFPGVLPLIPISLTEVMNSFVENLRYAFQLRFTKCNQVIYKVNHFNTSSKEDNFEVILSETHCLVKRLLWLTNRE